MTQFTQLSCAAFTEALASKTSIPGGGGTAAMVGALGIALCAMAGNFTTGKKKFAAVEADVQRILADCEALRLRFLALVEEDALAFEPLSKAYAIPKDTPHREEILESATQVACAAPMEMVVCCGKALVLLDEMLEKGSRLLITDVGCGALLCKAAMESAALNIFINTRTLKDRSAAARLEQEVDRALCQYLPMADRIIAAVTTHVRKEN